MGFSGDRLIDSQGEIETLDYTCSVVIGRTLGVEEASTKSVPVDVKGFHIRRLEPVTNLALSLIVNPRLNPQRPELPEVRPSLIENGGIVMGHQGEAFEFVCVRRKRLGENDHCIPIFRNWRAKQYANRISTGCGRIGNDTVRDKRIRAEAPDQFIQLFSLLLSVTHNAHPVALLPGLAHKLGGVQVAGCRGVLQENMKPVALVFIFLCRRRPRAAGSRAAGCWCGITFHYCPAWDIR